MTQAQKIAEAERLQTEGLSVRQIARRMGYGKSTVGEWLKPHYCACGNRMAHRYTRCDDCRIQFLRERVHQRAERIEAWWAHGLSQAVIAHRLGWTRERLAVEMDRLRGKGYDLPYRHRGARKGRTHPEQVAA